MGVSFVFLPREFQASSSGGKYFNLLSHAGTGSLLIYTPTKNLASIFICLFIYILQFIFEFGWSPVLKDIFDIAELSEWWNIYQMKAH